MSDFLQPTDGSSTFLLLRAMGIANILAPAVGALSGVRSLTLLLQADAGAGARAAASAAVGSERLCRPATGGPDPHFSMNRLSPQFRCCATNCAADLLTFAGAGRPL